MDLRREFEKLSLTCIAPSFTCADCSDLPVIAKHQARAALSCLPSMFLSSCLPTSPHESQDKAVNKMSSMWRSEPCTMRYPLIDRTRSRRFSFPCSMMPFCQQHNLIRLRILPYEYTREANSVGSLSTCRQESIKRPAKLPTL